MKSEEGLKTYSGMKELTFMQFEKVGIVVGGNGGGGRRKKMKNQRR